MLTYQPRHPENLIIGAPSDTAVSTGWTPRRSVYVKIQDHPVAVIGNLYSEAGIRTLILNLAYNHQITKLVHLEGSPLDRNVGTTNRLISVWQGGPYPEVDDEILLAVVGRVKLFVFRNIDTVISHLTGRYPPELDPNPQYHYPQLTYPLPEQPIEVQAREYQNGLVIRGCNLSEAWLRLLRQVSDHGALVDGGHGNIIDVGSVMTIAQMYPSHREIIPTHLTRGDLDRYSQTLLRPDAREDYYTYGSRINGRLGVIAEILNNHPSSTRAVLGLLLATDLGSDNPPCLTTIGFQIRGGRLHCRAVFRSHDVWSGWYPNAYALTRLSEHLLTLLTHNLLLGELTVISESAHIYESALGAARQGVRRMAPKQLRPDPVGNFVIRVTPRLCIKHYSQNGARHLGEYSDPLAVLRANPTMDTEHYGYLCSEWTAVQIQGEAYRQDQYRHGVR